VGSEIHVTHDFTEIDCDLAQLASEGERHLVVLVIHWRTGIEADIESKMMVCLPGDTASEPCHFS